MCSYFKRWINVKLGKKFQLGTFLFPDMFVSILLQLDCTEEMQQNNATVMKKIVSKDLTMDKTEEEDQLDGPLETIAQFNELNKILQNKDLRRKLVMRDLQL